MQSHDFASRSIDQVPTELLLVTPDFVEALRKVAPRPRRAKLPYVVGLAVLAALGVLGLDGSFRELVQSHARTTLVDTGPAIVSVPIVRRPR